MDAPELNYIQDIAGERCPVAPFALSIDKNRYAVLCYIYNEYKKLIQVQLYDYVDSHGARLNYRRSISHGGDYLCEYFYNKYGKPWKTFWYYTYPRKWSHPDKIGPKYPKLEDSYIDGYLHERKYYNEYRIETYNFSERDRSIFLKIIDSDVIVRLHECYDEQGNLISNSHSKCSVYNPSIILENEKTMYFYHENTLTHSISLHPSRRDAFYCEAMKDIYTDIDSCNNWLTRTRYVKRFPEGKEILRHIEKREIAYNELSAMELREKFEALYADHENLFRSSNSPDWYIKRYSH